MVWIKARYRRVAGEVQEDGQWFLAVPVLTCVVAVVYSFFL